MNLSKKSTRSIFLLSAFLALSVPVLLPSFRILFFAPYLIIICYQKPYISCLWSALLCGIIIDLFSSPSRFGLQALNYCLTTGILWKQKRHFFADRLSTLPVMTYLFGLLSTCIQAIFTPTFTVETSLSWTWIASDLICMPMLDAAYGFTLFILPHLVFGKPQRRGKDYFLR